MSKDNNYCVYLHRRKDTKEIVYVGEGRLSRAKSISSRAGRNKNYNKLVESVGLYSEIYQDGLTKEEAELFGLHSRYVSLVRHGKRWKHLYIDHGKGIPSSFTATKHTEEQIMWVYDLVTNSDMTNKNISILTGMEVSTVSRLRSGKMFRRVIERKLNK